MHLLAISLRGRDPELVGDRCWQAGAIGLWHVDDVTLRAGVPAGALAGFLAELDDLEPVDVTATESVELAGRSSTVRVAGHHVELWVPATVFGDGTHPTTAACLELLPGIVTPGSHVLDVGCGAGALSVAAALLGARVLAIDIDPDAVAATADNGARNGVALSTSAAPLHTIGEQFDVVLANLTVGSLAPMAPQLVPLVYPGGSLVLSGMLEDQWDPISAVVGGAVVEHRVTEGWVTARVVLGSV